MLFTTIVADPALSTKPNIALAIFHDTKDVIAGQAILGSKAVPVSVVEAAYAAIGNCPDVSVFIFDQTRDLVAGQAIFRGKRLPFITIEPVQSAAAGVESGHPQITLAVRQGTAEPGHKRQLIGQGLHISTIKMDDTFIFSHKPDVIAYTWEYRVYHALCGEALPVGAIKAADAAAGKPEVTLTILGYIVDNVVTESIGYRKSLPGAAVKTADTLDAHAYAYLYCTTDDLIRKYGARFLHRVSRGMG